MEIVGDLHPGLVQVRPVQARQAIHRQNRDTPAGKHPGKIVVDEGIRVIVDMEGRREHLLAVAGGAQAQHLQPDAQLPIFFCQRHESLPDHPQGFSLVVGVEGVRHLLVLIHKDELGGSRPGVDT